jgi:hypothetical protein
LALLTLDSPARPDGPSDRSGGCHGGCSACDSETARPPQGAGDDVSDDGATPRLVVAWAFAFLTPIVLGAAAAATAESASAQALLGLGGAAAGIWLAQLIVRWLGFRGEAR